MSFTFVSGHLVLEETEHGDRLAGTLPLKLDEQFAGLIFWMPSERWAERKMPATIMNRPAWTDCKEVQLSEECGQTRALFRQPEETGVATQNGCRQSLQAEGYFEDVWALTGSGDNLLINSLLFSLVVLVMSNQTQVILCMQLFGMYFLLFSCQEFFNVCNEFITLGSGMSFVFFNRSFNFTIPFHVFFKFTTHSIFHLCCVITFHCQI